MIKLKKQTPTTAELIERGFAPKNGKIDVLLIHPPSTIAERYGKEDMGEFGGDLIPLGIASLAGFLREKGYGVGVLDCPTLRIDSDKVYEIIVNKDLFRPNEIMDIYGDSSKAKKILNWEYEISFFDVLDIIIDESIENRN